MNKHNCLLDMIVNKILFISRRYNYNSNNTSFFKKLIFIFLVLSSLILLLIILKRSSSATVEEEIINDTTSLLKNDIDILKVEAAVYYKLTQDKNNKLFSLIIAKTNKTYLTSISSRNPRILVNKLYSYKFEIKYKKCYKSNISINSKASHSIRINSAKTLIYNEILAKLLIEYYNYIDVFDRTKADKLLSHRSYNYKLKFIDNYNKIGLSKSRIYSIFGYKLK